MATENEDGKPPERDFDEWVKKELAKLPPVMMPQTLETLERLWKEKIEDTRVIEAELKKILN